MKLIEIVDEFFNDYKYTEVHQTKENTDLYMVGRKKDKLTKVNLSNLSKMFGELRMYHFEEDDAITEIRMFLDNYFLVMEESMCDCPLCNQINKMEKDETYYCKVSKAKFGLVEE